MTDSDDITKVDFSIAIGVMTMTLAEAKEFYFKYNGFSFHMDREEPAKSGSFRMLNLGKDTLRKWDEELLDHYFDRLWSEPEHTWGFHKTILDIVRRKNCDVDKCLGKLLREMEKMEDLDLFNMTLVIENMAGNTEPQKDGGVYVFGRYSDLAGRMNDVMEHLIAVYPQSHEVNDRFTRAVYMYRKAYGKWAKC